MQTKAGIQEIRIVYNEITRSCSCHCSGKVNTKGWEIVAAWLGECLFERNFRRLKAFAVSPLASVESYKTISHFRTVHSLRKSFHQHNCIQFIAHISWTSTVFCWKSGSPQKNKWATAVLGNTSLKGRAEFFRDLIAAENLSDGKLGNISNFMLEFSLSLDSWGNCCSLLEGNGLSRISENILLFRS